MCCREGAQHAMGFRVRGNPRKESCILNTEINGANKGPRVSASQGAWQVGRTSLGKLYFGIFVSRSGGRLGGGLPHGKAGQGSPGQQSRERCPSEWPKHGQGQEQGS